MSASPIARQACSHAQAIPSRKVLLTDPSQMPDVYSSTPGGTLYSTTPGGTRIIYERAFLMNLKNSPLGRTPPKDFLPPGIAKNSPPKSTSLSVPHKQVTQPRSERQRTRTSSTWTCREGGATGAIIL